jgi:hypothetical protein
MTESIIPTEAGQLAQKFDDAAFNAVNTATGFLPRIQVMGSSSAQCKEGKFQVGRWALVKNKEFIDIGASITAAIIAWRPRALDFKDRNAVISAFDPSHPEFKRIQSQAGIKDSDCLCGPEFLVWLPEQKTFATLYMANNSGQQEAPVVRKHIGKVTTLSCVFVPSKKYGGWHAPKCQPCSAGLSTPMIPEELKKEHEKFMNPPATETETATPEQAAAAGRAR